MEKNRRKIVYSNGAYQLLKPREGERWHDYGERKSLKAINDIIETGKYDLEISEDILRALKEYKEKKKIWYQK